MRWFDGFGNRVQALLVLLAIAGIAQAQIRVGAGGQASVEIPIAVPPGVGGLQPSISLVYSDGSSNGALGTGWRLSGISMVSRCPSTLTLDRRVKGVGFTDDDQLCLDGNRLIRVNGPAGTTPWPEIIRNADGSVLSSQSGLAGGGAYAGGTKYLVGEFDGSRLMYSSGDLLTPTIQFSNGAIGTYYGGGPAEFYVTGSDGRRFEYGTDRANLQSVVFSATPFRLDFGSWYTTSGSYGAHWLLSRVVDASGNALVYKYAQRDLGQSVGREWVLSEISYASGAQAKKVVFEYEDKSTTLAPASDITTARQVDTAWRGQWRLKSIKTYTNAISAPVLVKSYRLSYERSAQSGNSRLVSVKECADAGESVCQPGTLISYADNGANVSYAANSAFALSAVASTKMVTTGGGDYSGGAYGTLVGDFNGDGRADIVRWSNNSAENQLWLSNGNGTFTLTAAPLLATEVLHTSTDCSGQYGSLGTINFGPGVTSHVGDFNGDGRADILRVGGGCGSPTPGKIFLSQGDGQFVAVQLPAGIQLDQFKSIVYAFTGNPSVFRSEGRRFFVLDLNGDGLLDIVTTKLKGYVYETPYGAPPDEASLCSVADLCNTAYKASFNAQGELVYTEDLSWAGRGWPSLYADPPKTGDIHFHWRPQSVGDVNGDGLDDIMSAYTGQWISANGAYTATVPGADSACPTMVDYNGDGAKDCLLPKEDPNLQKLTYSQGFASASEGIFNLKTAGDNLVAFVPLNGSQRQSVGNIGYDFNGDGRDDILRWGPTPADNGIYLSNGDGTFRARAGSGLQNITRPLRSADGSTSFVLGDFLGIGSVQILHLKENPVGGSEASANQLYVRGGQHMRPDLLQSVTSPSGLVSSVVSRAPITNAAGRYISERVAGSPAAPKLQDLEVPLQVVTRTTEATGVGSSVITTDYLYKGLKRERGRGVLGFAETRRQTPAANGVNTIVTVNEHLMTHPYIGSIARTRSYLGGSGTSALLSVSGLPLLSDTSNTYCDTYSSTSPATATPSAPCAYGLNAVFVRPYLRQTSTAAWDLNGAALPTTTTTHTYTGKYLTQSDKSTTGSGPAGQQSFLSRTVHEYWPDITGWNTTTNQWDWILGRVKKTTVTNTVPNSLSGTAAGAGNAPKATATAGP